MQLLAITDPEPSSGHWQGRARDFHQPEDLLVEATGALQVRARESHVVETVNVHDPLLT
jgi:hypothetical protein